MKTVQQFFVVFLTCTICLFAVTGEAFAAAEKQAPSVAVGTPPAETSSPVKAKKEIPTSVDINTADKAVLTALPGIGPVTADAILAYRQENGNFKNLDELTKVKGIGDKTLAKLKPYLQEI